MKTWQWAMMLYLLVATLYRVHEVRDTLVRRNAWMDTHCVCRP